MNDAHILDEFERDVVYTLRAKADQLVVDDAPFRHDLTAPPAPAGRRAGTPRPGLPRRRMLAAAAIVAVLVGGGAVVTTALNRADTPDVTMPITPVALWTTMPEEGTAAFVPMALPDGWTLREMGARPWPAEGPATWQLFAVDGTSPLPRGVLVGSSVDPDRVLGANPTHTVQGQPAVFRPSTDPLVPASALEVVWADGEVFHDVVAVGLTQVELLDFLESLVPHNDPATGLDAPPDASLPELDAVTTPSQAYVSLVGYVGPAEGDSLSVRAESADLRGGLLHRLVGEPHADGLVIRGGDPGYQFASLVRDDGWTVDVSMRPAPHDPAQLDAILDRVEPVTQQQLINTGVAEPVTATETVGDWTVEFHGSEQADVAMCLTAARDEVCTTAQNSPQLPGLTTGSAIVDGEWLVVALTNGTDAASIEATPSSHERPDVLTQEPVHGERRRSGDHVIEVLTVPAGVDAVVVTIPTGEDSVTGALYDRPNG